MPSESRTLDQLKELVKNLGGQLSRPKDRFVSKNVRSRPTQGDGCRHRGRILQSKDFNRPDGVCAHISRIAIGNRSSGLHPAHGCESGRDEAETTSFRCESLKK